MFHDRFICRDYIEAQIIRSYLHFYLTQHEELFIPDVSGIFPANISFLKRRLAKKSKKLTT